MKKKHIMIALSLALSITAFSFCEAPPKQEAAAADVQYTEEVCEDCTEPVEELGTFTTYAYCTCGQCCSEQNGITASGTVPEEGVTVAADPDVIPLGSHIVVAWDNGSFMREYTVEDTGSNIKGKTLDIYMESHEAALEFGVQELEVYLLEE